MTSSQPPTIAPKNPAVSASIHLDVTAAGTDSLAHVVAAADEIAATTVSMLGDAIAVQTRLHVNTRKLNPRRLS